MRYLKAQKDKQPSTLLMAAGFKVKGAVPK
jgi:hypothetical protein